MSTTAFIFFGLVKNYDSIIGSFHKYISPALTDADYFLVTSRITKLRHTWNKDLGAELKPDSILKHFKFRDVWYDGLEDDESAFAKELKDKTTYYVCAFGSHWTDMPWTCTYNSLKQIYSLKLLYNEFTKKQYSYKTYVLCRGDAFFESPLDAKHLTLGASDIVLPDFEEHKGLNDRFGIMNEKAFKVYCSRYDNIMGNPRTYHAERLLAEVVSKSGLKLSKISDPKFTLLRL